MTEQQSARKHVSGGYCLDDGTSNDGMRGSFCALEFKQCRSAGQIYRSSRETLSAGGMASCYNRREVEKVYIGKCEDANCGVTQKSCQSPNNFIPADGSIPASNGALFNRDPNCKLTKALFGTCDEECVWSSEVCEENKTFIPANENSTCTCDRVLVGGCKYSGAPIFCAVSPDSCDAFQTYLTPQQVQDQEQTSCYLCRPPTTSSPTISPTAAIHTPVFNNQIQRTNESVPNLSIVLGGLAMLFTIVFFGFFIRKRYRLKKQEAPPTLCVITPKDYHEEEDNVSEFDNQSFSSK